MIDLTKIDTPFCELEREVRWALKGAYSDNAIIQSHSKEIGWVDVSSPAWLPHTTYRLKPKPVVVEKTYRMGFAAYQSGEPIVSDGHKNNPEWMKVNITVEWTDDKVTAVSAELAE